MVATLTSRHMVARFIVISFYFLMSVAIASWSRCSQVFFKIFASNRLHPQSHGRNVHGYYFYFLLKTGSRHGPDAYRYVSHFVLPTVATLISISFFYKQAAAPTVAVLIGVFYQLATATQLQNIQVSTYLPATGYHYMFATLIGIYFFAEELCPHCCDVHRYLLFLLPRSQCSQVFSGIYFLPTCYRHTVATIIIFLLTGYRHSIATLILFFFFLPTSYSYMITAPKSIYFFADIVLSQLSQNS